MQQIYEDVRVQEWTMYRSSGSGERGSGGEDPGANSEGNDLQSNLIAEVEDPPCKRSLSALKGVGLDNDRGGRRDRGRQK